MKDICPDCGSRLVKHLERHEYEYRGKTFGIDAVILSCSSCGKEINNTKQFAQQKKRIELAADGYLTDKEILAIRTKFGLTQVEFAKKLGVAEKTFARYENLSVRQSKCMDHLLRILDKHPEMLEILEGNNIY
jgi:HTH-type transcriptional regulator / antitoxin MqsA